MNFSLCTNMLGFFAQTVTNNDTFFHVILFPLYGIFKFHWPKDVLLKLYRCLLRSTLLLKAMIVFSPTISVLRNNTYYYAVNSVIFIVKIFSFFLKNNFFYLK